MQTLDDRFPFIASNWIGMRFSFACRSHLFTLAFESHNTKRLFKPICALALKGTHLSCVILWSEKQCFKHLHLFYILCAFQSFISSTKRFFPLKMASSTFFARTECLFLSTLLYTMSHSYIFETVITKGAAFDCLNSCQFILFIYTPR